MNRENYKDIVEQLEDALTEELKELFRGEYFWNSLAHKVRLRVYAHAEPVREGSDDAVDAELPEPYIIVKAGSGAINDEDSAHDVQVVCIICCCDHDTKRGGHTDVLHIIDKIYHRFAVSPDLAGRFVFRYPVNWEIAEEDTYPYYLGGIQLTFECPPIVKEDPLA